MDKESVPQHSCASPRWLAQEAVQIWPEMYTDLPRDCESRLDISEWHAQELILSCSYTDEGNFGEIISTLKDSRSTINTS